MMHLGSRESRIASRDSRSLIWIVYRYPVIAAGLERILRTEFRVHLGESPPEEGIPSFVVLFAEDAGTLQDFVERAREPNPEARVVVFGLRADLLLARTALRAGARGYIHAGNTPVQILRALKVVADGEIAAPRGLLEHLLTEMTGGGATADLDTLSSRQREVLKLAADGLSNAQIGERLYLSESTVKQHLRSVYRLLGVKNRNEAARLTRNGNHEPYSRAATVVLS